MRKAITTLALYAVLAPVVLRGEEPGAIVSDDLSDGLAQWVWEGPPGSIVDASENSLLLDPRAAEHREPGTEGLNLWHRTPLSGDWSIEYDLEPISPRAGDGEKCNLLFMFNCRYVDRKIDLIEHSPQRTGHYFMILSRPRDLEQYQRQTGTKVPVMRGYTITYYRIEPEADPPYKLVVRRNPNLQLLGEVIQSAEDQWAYRHKVRIEKRGRRILLYQGDQRVLEVADESDDGPWSEGYFGLRAWRVAVRVHGVTVRRLPPAEP